jgi:hypothetical protein
MTDEYILFSAKAKPMEQAFGLVAEKLAGQAPAEGLLPEDDWFVEISTNNRRQRIRKPIPWLDNVLAKVTTQVNEANAAGQAAQPVATPAEDEFEALLKKHYDV